MSNLLWFPKAGRQYERPSIVLPKPELSGTTLSGRFTGGLDSFFLVHPRYDKKPLMSFGNNYNRVWFKLY